MTVQPIEAVDTDTIAHLDFNEHRACEHPVHTRRHDLHADGNEQYVRATCETCGRNEILIRCARWLAYITAGAPFLCTCGQVSDPEHFQILGPANT